MRLHFVPGRNTWQLYPCSRGNIRLSLIAHVFSCFVQGGSESDPGFVIYTDVSSISQNTGEVESKEDDTEDKENM